MISNVSLRVSKFVKSASYTLKELTIAVYEDLKRLLYEIEENKQDNLIPSTGIDITNSVITNTLPDQTVTIASGTNISVTATYVIASLNTREDQ